MGDFNTRSELDEIRALVESGGGLPILPEARRRLGCCRWGHPGYIRETTKSGVPYFEWGPNAYGKAMGRDEARTSYCAECRRLDRRAQIKSQHRWKGRRGNGTKFRSRGRGRRRVPTFREQLAPSRKGKGITA